MSKTKHILRLLVISWGIFLGLNSYAYYSLEVCQESVECIYDYDIQQSAVPHGNESFHIYNNPAEISSEHFETSHQLTWQTKALPHVYDGGATLVFTQSFLAPKNADKWSRQPKSIQDKMALEAAEKGAGRPIIKNLNDPKYKGMEKWEYKVKSTDGKDAVVHYVKDPKTGKSMDFKFKKHSTEGSGNWANTPEPKVPPGGN